MTADRMTGNTIGRTVVFVALLLLLWVAKTMLLLMFGGVLLAIFLHGMSGWVERRIGVGRRWALGIVVMLIVSALALGVWLRGPELVAQAGQLQERLPQATSAALARLQQHSWARWITARLSESDAFAAPGVLARLTSVLSSTVALATAAFIVLFTGFYLAVEPELYLRGILRLFPPARRPRWRAILNDAGALLRRWLMAKAVSMIAVGALVTLGLYLLDIPLVWTLGALATVLTFIPNIGPILSAVPPVLLALAISPERALSVVLLFWGVHAFEGFFVTPLIERGAVKLPPALTIAMQVLLGITAGALGVALAAPLTAVGIVLVRSVYVEDVLGDHAPR